MVFAALPTMVRARSRLLDPAEASVGWRVVVQAVPARLAPIGIRLGRMARCRRVRDQARPVLLREPILLAVGLVIGGAVQVLAAQACNLRLQLLGRAGQIIAGQSDRDQRLEPRGRHADDLPGGETHRVDPSVVRRTRQPAWWVLTR